MADLAAVAREPGRAVRQIELDRHPAAVPYARVVALGLGAAVREAHGRPHRIALRH